MTDDKILKDIENAYSQLMTEEFKSGVKKFAELLYLFFSSLTKQGFTREEAIWLTIEFQKAINNFGK